MELQVVRYQKGIIFLLNNTLINFGWKHNFHDTAYRVKPYKLMIGSENTGKPFFYTKMLCIYLRRICCFILFGVFLK